MNNFWWIYLWDDFIKWSDLSINITSNSFLFLILNDGTLPFRSGNDYVSVFGDVGTFPDKCSYTLDLDLIEIKDQGLHEA